MANELSGTKYKALYDWIAKSIDSRKVAFGEKLPSENMLCQKFGISRQTVRNALAELEKAEYVSRFKGKGTFVKKKVTLGRADTVGVCLSFLENYIFPNVLHGIEEVLTEHGFGIDFGFGNNRVDQEAKFLRRMLDMNVSGLIVEGVKSAFPTPNEQYYKELQRANIPIVFVHNYYSNVKCPCVLMDDETLMAQLTELLIQAGHRRIAGVFKFDDLQGILRYTGFVKALMKAGLPVNEDLVAWYDSTNLESARVRTDCILEEFADVIVKKGVTAFACYNDLIASRMVEKLEARGVRVPEDVSLVGFDNSEIVQLKKFRLTTAHHPKDLLGETAAKKLLHLIHNPQEPQDKRTLYIMGSEIFMGDSIREI